MIRIVFTIAIAFILSTAKADPILFCWGNCTYWKQKAFQAKVIPACFEGNPYTSNESLKLIARSKPDIILFPKSLLPLFGPRAFTGSVLKLKGYGYCYPVSKELCLGVWAGSQRKEEAIKRLPLLKAPPIKEARVSGWWKMQLEKSLKANRPSTPIKTPIPNLKAKILRFREGNYPSKVFIVRFDRPRMILSTLEGLKKAAAVGNYYIYPARWGNCRGINLLKKDLARRVGLPPKQISLLYTGVDMDNIAFHTERYKDLTVWVAVTAGVFGNAMRAGIDKGYWLETPSGWEKVGTINLLIFVNKRLEVSAMASAIIRATEAKTAVLQELNVKSSYNSDLLATGTGTDNIIIVSAGEEGRFTSAGGHTLLGYMIAKSVREALFRALYLQNGLNIYPRARLLSSPLCAFNLLKPNNPEEVVR